MKKSTEILRLIILPFIAAAVLFPFLYVFFIWLFVSTLEFAHPEENMIRIFLPFIFSLIIVLGLLRPRLKLLDIHKHRNDAIFGLVILATIALALPASLAQGYITTTSEKVTDLNNIKSIVFNPPTRFYTVESFYPHKRRASVYSCFTEKGKNKENFEMTVYIVVPMLPRSADTLTGKCTAWMGLSYKKEISNTLSREEKSKAFRFFVEKSEAEFHDKNLNSYQYYTMLGEKDDRTGFISAVKNNWYYINDTTNILVASETPLTQAKGNSLAWVFVTFIFLSGLMIFIVLRTGLRDGAVKLFERGEEAEVETDESIFEQIKPREGFFITPLIVLMNVMVFVAMVIAGLGFMSFRGEDLLSWGGNYRPMTLDGQLWRLVTFNFLHGGIIHLVANMYGLVFVGLILEPRIGRLKFAMAYMFTGIMAGCASLLWHDVTISVGASGAVFGLYGLFLVLLLTKVYPREVSKGFLLATVVFVAVNLLSGIKDGIDNAAHIGGLISGAILGLAYSSTLHNPQSKTLNTVLIALTIAGVSAISSIFLILNTGAENRYNKLMTGFSIREEKALEVFKMPDGASKQLYLDKLNNESIPNMKACRDITLQIDSIRNLPEELAEKNKLVKRYCDYRLIIFDMVKEAEEKNSTVDMGLIGAYNQAIDRIARKLNGEYIADSLMVVNPLRGLRKDVLYVVDGDPVEDIGDLDPAKVRSISVIGGRVGYMIYGERGRNGAVIITTAK